MSKMRTTEPERDSKVAQAEDDAQDMHDKEKEADQGDSG